MYHNVAIPRACDLSGLAQVGSQDMNVYREVIGNVAIPT